MVCANNVGGGRRVVGRDNGAAGIGPVGLGQVVHDLNAITAGSQPATASGAHERIGFGLGRVEMTSPGRLTAGALV